MQIILKKSKSIIFNAEIIVTYLLSPYGYFGMNLIYCDS